ncbi:MAG: DUF362 domain-containing protein [Nitrospinae bacterium]|nr:DUF362 domain-containing protein [Nitrospinota bacterium]
MQTDVALKACTDYDPARVKESIASLIDLMGGLGKFVTPGDSVLLKPNMLAPATPEKAVTTHPAVVRAVAELVLDAGGKPFIADSPAVPGFAVTAKRTGLGEVAKGLGIPIFDLKESTEFKAGDNRIFRMLELSRHALEANRIINLPKFKTHAQMYLTGGVKNTFGCVVGSRKAQWHFKAGIDRIFFARMLVEVHHAVDPDLTILDTIEAMEGDGPGTGGTPRHIGLLAAATDAVALDRTMLDIAGGELDNFFVMRAAAEMGIGETDPRRIRVLGDDAARFAQRDFRFPKTGTVIFGPKAFQRFVLNHLTAKPMEDRSKCTLCNKCIEICPTEIITVKNGKLAFNYDKCIRCFCCVEVCPEGAMKPATPLLLKIVS